MKLARNLFLALAFLVLLYGGAYRFFFRESVRKAMAVGELFPTEPARWHKIFTPAAEFDVRLTYDRPRRKYFRGHWTNPKTGDFVTIAGNGTFTLQLGKTRASGQATLDRLFGRYYAKFQDGGLTRSFAFYGYDPAGSRKTHDIAVATTSLLTKTQSESENYKTTLTRARAPAPAP